MLFNWDSFENVYEVCHKETIWAQVYFIKENKTENGFCAIGKTAVTHGNQQSIFVVV